MQKKVVWVLLALVVLGLAVPGFAQDSTGAGGGAVKAIGDLATIAGLAGLVLKVIIYLLEQSAIKNQYVAALGAIATAVIVGGVALWFNVDYQVALGAVSSGSWLGSLGSTFMKPNTK